MLLVLFLIVKQISEKVFIEIINYVDTLFSF